MNPPVRRHLVIAVTTVKTLVRAIFWHTAIATMVVGAALFAHAAQADAWDLDLGFGTGGKVVTNFDAGGNNLDRVVKILRYPDRFGGKYVAVGRVNMAGNVLAIGLARYLSNGALDPTFGSGGKVIKDACMSDITNAAFDSQFRIVVVGSTSCSGNATKDVAVVRFNAFGGDDTSFAGDGGLAFKYTKSFDREDFAGAVLVLSDDSLLVGGGLKAVGGVESPYIQKVSASGVVAATASAQGLPTASDRRIIGVVLDSFNSSIWLVRTVAPTQLVIGAVWKINNASLASDTGFSATGGEHLLINSATAGFESCGTTESHQVTSIVRFGTRVVMFGYTNASPSLSFFMTRALDGGLRTYGCIKNGANAIDFTTLAATGSPDQGGSIYLAGSKVNQMGLFRVVKGQADGSTWVFDPNFNGGVPVGIDFPSATGQPLISGAASIVHSHLQTVIAGARVWNNTTSDLDFAMARFGELIFTSGFE